MKSTEFCYWLQGFFEISGGKATTLSVEQVEIIKKHLNLVFFHEIDPSYTSDPNKQEQMNSIHETGFPGHGFPYDGNGTLRC